MVQKVAPFGDGLKHSATNSIIGLQCYILTVETLDH
jgi:hypothetical protein